MAPRESEAVDADAGGGAASAQAIGMKAASSVPSRLADTRRASVGFVVMAAG
jgi:hypothetical protein